MASTFSSVMAEFRVFVCLCVLLISAGMARASSIDDVEHVIIWMQENRPFDQYYGKLAGVRGFNDQSCPPLPTGRRPFYQPLNDMGPTASACYGSLCYVQGQECPFLTPGSGWTGRRCCAGRWQDGTDPCPPLPNATDCQDQLCSIPDQLCVVGTPGAGAEGKRCCNGNWRNSTDSCPEPAYMLPWHVDTFATSGTCMSAPGMDYNEDIAMWNGGRMDRWCTARAPGFGWGHFDRSDLAYYYALADEFLIGDQYFQSTFTATNPNRLHMFSGSNNNIREQHKSGGPLYQALDDLEPGFTWETMAETLEKKGVSWKVFQEEDNFDDNAFAWFDNFRNAKPGDPLWDKGMDRVPTNQLVPTLAKYFANGSLPQVSYVVAPMWRSEHSNNHPQDGEDLTAQILKVLQQYPEVYKKTALFFNYDEGGQYIDHHWTPTPPRNDLEGLSTVDTFGELTVRPQFFIPAGNPMGLGFRVPFMIISPWTRGPVVYSGVADHTSVLKFIEKRFNVTCPNITPWRRAVTTDLLDAFDWNNPNYTWPSLPDTSGYPNETRRECDQLPPPQVPAVQQMPLQERGTRISRALPYCHDIRSTVVHVNGTDALLVNMSNCGQAGNVFSVHDLAAPTSLPRPYTVEAGKQLSDIVWPSHTTAAVQVSGYSQSLHGPNGFVRQFQGAASTSVVDGRVVATVAQPSIEAVLRYDAPNGAVLIDLSAGPEAFLCTAFVVEDRSYDTGGPWLFKVQRGSSTTSKHVVSAQGNWYDFSVTAGDCSQLVPSGASHRLQDAAVVVSRGFKGRMETGSDTISDPAMGLPGAAFVSSVLHEVHPRLSPEQYYNSKGPKQQPAPVCERGVQGFVKDLCPPEQHDEL